MNSNFKEMVLPTLVLFVICIVATALLTGTYQVAKPIIDQRAQEAANSSRGEVLPEGDVFTPMEGVTLVDGVTEVYQAQNGAGIVCIVAKSGFGGKVELMIGVNAEGAITGMKVMSHAETPNLGTNALTEEHFSQFIGATAINKDGSGEGTKIDAYSGATITSTAVYDDVDAALQQYAVANGAAYEAPVQLSPEEAFAAALLAVLPGADSFEKAEGELAENVIEIHKAANGTGFVAYTQGIGYAGESAPIKAVVGVDGAGAVTGVQILENSETNGIGTQAFEEPYTGQFIGATGITRKASDEGKTKIETVSGATMSSVGVYDCVKAAIKQYELMGGAI